MTPLIAARQAPLSFTISQSFFKLMSIESVMPSNHLILCLPLLLLPSIFPSIKVFSNESTLPMDGQSIGASASASVLPRNIQGWFSLELTSLISLLSKGPSKVFSSTTVWKHQFFGTQPSLWTLQNLGILFIDSAFYDGCYFFENVNVLSILGHFSEFDVILFYTF